MSIIKKMYCYSVFALLFVVMCAFHFFFACLFLLINQNAFHDVISRFENDIFKIIEDAAKE